MCTEALGTQLVASRLISRVSSRIPQTQWYDPLAQSFLVDDPTGVFLTKMRYLL